ncbi:MAG: 6-phosphogluconolactonase [Deltaproteobacteria bacterium]|nr:6-phosphogluconolactonase [Deltaproteobacteria bacterium]
MIPSILPTPTETDVARRVAAELLDFAKETIATRGRVVIGLPGGQTPLKLYEVLASEFASAAPWSEVVITFGDERCVPRDHPESNQKRLHDVLLDRVDIPEVNVMEPIGPEVTAEVRDAAIHKKIAADYSAALEQVVGEFGSLDLVLLGLGTDGHTASLFPPALESPSPEPLVVPTLAPKTSPVRARISLSYGALRAAREVWVLVTGGGKAEILSRVLAGEESLPLSKVIRDRVGNVRFFVDAAAAQPPRR